ncbi:MAG: hypothetical protein RR775_22525 [Massilia sp.]
MAERHGIKTDKDSGIINDANEWAVETMSNRRYPLELSSEWPLSAWRL